MGKFKAGDKVLCCYRLPTPHQYWIHPFHVGTVEEPGDDVNAWNGHNSERHYCEITNNVRVRYDFNVMHDSGEALFLSPIPESRMPTSEADAQTIVDLAQKECPEYYKKLDETLVEVYHHVFAK